MKRIVLILSILILYSGEGSSQIFSKAYGSPAGVPLIFIHGGPGFNSAVFEFTAAETLAAKGYYVIVYDQRGSGRSDTANAQYTFTESNNDIAALYEKYNIEKAILTGHSWGGAVAVKFAKEHPEKVQQVIFVSAPVDYPAVFESMLGRIKEMYRDSSEAARQNIARIESMEKGSVEHISGIFGYAMRSGFYSPKVITPEAKELYSFLFKPEISKIFAMMSEKPAAGFYRNENYTSLDLSKDITSLSGRVKFGGIYGDEDGLFDPGILSSISALTGNENFVIIRQASHNIFIDRREEFITAVQKLTK